MKFIKYSLIAAGLVSFTSCLKAKNDFAGQLDDPGNVVTAILEEQYMKADESSLGYHFSGNMANFQFGANPTEAVKFFTLHISQPRDKKVEGSMTVTIAQENADPGLGYDDLPANAISVAPVTVSAHDGTNFDVPVYYTVNKAALDPTKAYATAFRITGVSQGVYALNESHVTVIINGGAPQYNNSRILGRYVAVTTVVDSANLYRQTNNTRPYILSEGRYDPFGIAGGSLFQANTIFLTNLQYYGQFGSATAYSHFVNNTQTGAVTVFPSYYYVTDASGKVIDVRLRSNNASVAPTFDASFPNTFTYTANADKSLRVKFTAKFTIGGLTQPFTITDIYTTDPIQAAY